MSKADKKIGYRVAQIQTLKFTFEDVPLDQVKQLFKQEDKLGLSINTEIKISQDKSLIDFDVQTQLVNTQDDNTKLIEHTGRTQYKVEGLADFHNEEEGKYELPDEFMAQLFALAYSHARALIAVEISPTVYKDFYMLPVIDPNTFLDEN